MKLREIKSKFNKNKNKMIIEIGFKLDLNLNCYLWGLEDLYLISMKNKLILEIGFSILFACGFSLI